MIDQDLLARLCDAKDCLCSFCVASDCEKCRVSAIMADVFNEMEDLKNDDQSNRR